MAKTRGAAREMRPKRSVDAMRNPSEHWEEVEEEEEPEGRKAKKKQKDDKKRFR